MTKERAIEIYSSMGYASHLGFTVKDWFLAREMCLSGEVRQEWLTLLKRTKG